LPSTAWWISFARSRIPLRSIASGTLLASGIFVDREAFLTSSDAGMSFHYNFPSNFGDVHVGIYNGDGYNHSEANDEKAVQVRASIRPAPGVAVLQGLRVAAFYDGDDYAVGNPKRRAVGQVTFEHKFVNAGVDVLHARDQSSDAVTDVTARGWSAWVTPRTSFGLEGLLRYDDLKPNSDVQARKKRAIAGIAYWFPTMKGVSSAALLDYEQVKYDDLLGKPKEVRYALHTLITF